MRSPNALFRNLDVYGAEAFDTPKLESEQNCKDGVVREPWKRRKAPLLEAPGVAGWGRFSVEEKPSQV